MKTEKITVNNNNEIGTTTTVETLDRLYQALNEVPACGFENLSLLVMEKMHYSHEWLLWRAMESHDTDIIEIVNLAQDALNCFIDLTIADIMDYNIMFRTVGGIHWFKRWTMKNLEHQLNQLKELIELVSELVVEKKEKDKISDAWVEYNNAVYWYKTLKEEMQKTVV